MSTSYPNTRPSASSPVPYSAEIEAAVLACINDPRCSAWPDVLTPSLFYDVRHGPILEAAEIVRKEGKRPDPLNLIECLKARGNLEAAGGLTYVAGLPEQCTSPENFNDWVADLERYAGLRRALELGTHLQAKASDPNASIAELQALAREFSESRIDPQANGLETVLEQRRFNASTAPEKPSPRFLIGSVPISTPGNLTAISAPPKSGKSAFIGAMIAASMAQGDCDCLQVSSRNEEGHALIHLDTEQSPFDHHALLTSSLRRAGIAESPAWLLSYCITGFTVAESRAAFRLLLRKGLEQFGGVHSVILDGVADFVADPNDPGESFGFVTELHSLAIEYACPVIGIIHQNPGTEKTRGHLGSQLERKSESNISIARQDNTFVVWSEKNRKAPISKDYGPRFVWSDSAGMHISVASAKASRLEEEGKMLRLEAESVFTLANKEALSWREFLTSLARNSKLSDSGARKRMEKILKGGIITKNLIGHYELTK